MTMLRFLFTNGIRMDTRVAGAWHYAVLASFGTIAMLCAVLIVAQLPAWGDKRPEWIAAIGAIAAFAGTIWIATSERRRRYREERDLATLAAANIYDRVGEAYSAISRIAKDFDHANNQSPPDRHAMLIRLDGLKLWEQAEILPLVRLPDHIGTRLQRVCVRRDRMRRSLAGANRGTAPVDQCLADCRHDLTKCADDLSRSLVAFDHLLSEVYQDESDHVTLPRQHNRPSSSG
jgi:hypothetical protein